MKMHRGRVCSVLAPFPTACPGRSCPGPAVCWDLCAGQLCQWLESLVLEPHLCPPQGHRARRMNPGKTQDSNPGGLIWDEDPGIPIRDTRCSSLSLHL